MRPGTLGRSALVSGIFAAGIVALVLGLTLWPLIAEFHLRGDDYPLVLNSASYYIDTGDALKWVTSGYSDYFDNYPGWDTGTAFVRPTQNSFIWLLSWLVPVAGERIYLIGNHAMLALLAGLTCALLRRGTGTAPVLAVAGGVAFALSPAFHGSVLVPSYGTNLLAAVFSIGSLLLLLAGREPPGILALSCAALLQTFAVASHEAAAVLPFVTVLLLIATSRLPKNPRHLLVLAVPLIAFTSFRLLVSQPSALYPLRDGPRTVFEQLRFFIAQAFYPWDAYGFAAERNSSHPASLLGYGVGLIASLMLAAALLHSLFATRFSRSRMALLLACAVALTPALLNPIEPRFFAIGFGIVLFGAVFAIRGRTAWLLILVLTVATASSLAFHRGVFTARHSEAEHMLGSRSQFELVKRMVAATDPDVVVLVNDRYGIDGASALVEMAARPRRPTVEVVNSLVGPLGPGAQTKIVHAGDQLVIVNDLSDSQSAVFPPAVVDFSQPTVHFAYRALGDRGPGGSFQAETSIDPGRTLVIGFDAATYRPLEAMFIQDGSL